MPKILVIGNSKHIDIENIDLYDLIICFNIYSNTHKFLQRKPDWLCLNYGIVNRIDKFPKIHESIEYAKKIICPVPSRKFIENILRTILHMIHFKDIVPRYKKVYDSFISDYKLKDKIVIFSVSERDAVKKLLQQEGADKYKVPSTGFSILYYFINNKEFNNMELYYTCFNWKGIRKHPWDIEQRIISNWENKGLLKKI